MYEDVRTAFAALLRTLDETHLATRVPATPAWAVHDVVAHLVGLTADLNAQRFPTDADIGGVAWNDGQISARRTRTLDELLDEWDREGPPFDAGLQLFGRETECHFVGDLVTHVLDVAEALDMSIVVPDTAIDMALQHYTSFVDERLAELGRAMPAAIAALAPLDRLRLLSARRPLASVPGAESLAAVYDGTGDTFPMAGARHGGRTPRSVSHPRPHPPTGPA